MIRIVNDLYSVEECKQLANIGKANPFFELEELKAKNKNLITYSTSVDKYGDLLQRFFIAAEITNMEFFGFDIFKMQYYKINYNRYEPSHEYAWHMDSSDNRGVASDIKFTGILNVSTEPYEGGEFEIFLLDKTNEELAREFTTGSALFFPSPLPHRVKPVTKGLRESISYWFTGPKWK